MTRRRLRIGTGARALWRLGLSTARRALAARAPEAAASIGFFAVFSFFPLLLILVAVSSVLLSRLWTEEELLASVLRFVPVSRDLVSANMRVVLGARGAVGAVGAAGLLWSATGAFTALVRNLNRAWPAAPQRGAVKSRLVALAILGGLTGIAVLYLAARASTPLAANWAWAATAVSRARLSAQEVWRGVMVALVFGGLTLLYRLVPSAYVRWRHAVIGAGAATAAFVAATAGFAWYLNSGLARYNLVYGSLGALVALLAWIYLLALIVLLGAHLCASVGELHGRGATELTEREAPEAEAASGER